MADGSNDSSTWSNTAWAADPTWIGPYKVLQRLGEGGMGIVYLADQERPIRRRVALKLIKLGMDTEQVIARFEAERQALALMNHPNVAKVFDAGATEDGRPYFAMEFVKGEALTAYCDRHRLTTSDRLELFIQACNGVQHAHQKGIIHRDIKPSNVLVTIEDAKPVPKIIDFGVAKATDQKLTERTMFTQMGVMIGTPAYMSPEQAEMTALDIDTRTDVYSLGVVLYELLSGALPFDPKELRAAGFDEIRRRIREVEPSRPSLRISALGQDDLRRAAESRCTDAVTLRRQLHGDLDWIILRALAKDRTRRYASPSEFAADILRHLQNLPVEAGPPGASYRLRKFVARHRWAVLAGSTAAVLLLVFLMILGLQARRIAAERDLARQERDRAEGTADFLADVLASPDQRKLGEALRESLRSLIAGAARREKSTEEDVDARLSRFEEAVRGVSMADATQRLLEEQVLAPAARTIDDLVKKQPETAALMHAALARTYRRLELYEQAATHYGMVVEVLGEDHPEALTALQERGVMALVSRTSGNAEDLLKKALAGRRKILGDSHPDSLVSLLTLGYRLQWRKHFDEAETYFREAVATRRRVLGQDHPMTLGSIETLAGVLGARGMLDQALPLYREALEAKQRRLGKRASGTLASMVRLGRLLVALGRSQDAVPLYREALGGSAISFVDDSEPPAGGLDFIKWAEERLKDVATVRILFLERVSTHEVGYILRSGVQISRIAECYHVRPRNRQRVSDAVILSGPYEEIDRAERLLTDIGLSTYAVDPHPPIKMLRNRSSSTLAAEVGPLETRVIRVRPLNRPSASIILRAIYGIRGVHELEKDDELWVQAPPAMLDAGVATLSELGVMEDEMVQGSSPR